ncbi:uncharacterized protein PHACADRAFT_202666 [Phanerochaete carnosa HHB-10118-sp]|uniref:Uncharacterized protein n=1 Tax=Phanerochaete carnosa (strain HHB-10118-sp) TaxID=650164 RepID=K5VBS4_PHACS|nr:uncharacterized protein PHACADRAFT_202666 [Phanerochaete carnosa HHB-10118-sp]EKM48558.1 hypothetical protein PHACADRAFT_202666 [Phanerochaete carnosa HHB-10118-sp]
MYKVTRKLSTDNTAAVVSARVFLCSSVYRLRATLDKAELFNEFINPELRDHMRETILDNAHKIHRRYLEGEFEDQPARLAGLVDGLRGFGVNDEEIDAIIAISKNVDGVPSEEQDKEPTQGQDDPDH